MSLANAHPFGMNAGGWHFSHGIEGLGVLNIPVGSARRRAAHQGRDRSVAPPASPTCTGCSATSRTTYADAARSCGLDPARDLNLTIAGDHPSEQYLMASSGLEALPLLGSACDERDGAHLAEDLAIVEVIDRHTGRPCGHGERGNLVVTVLGEGQLPAALRPRRHRALEHEALSVRRDAPPPVLRRPRARHRPRRHARGAADRRGAGALRVSRGLDAVGRVPDRAHHASRAQALHVRLEYDRGADHRRAPRSRAAWASASASASVWRRILILLPAVTLPRFAYKAARVVDE